MNLTTFKRRWFFVTFCSDLALAWIILKLINNLPNFVINPARKQQISSLICYLLFRFIFYLNPQIKIKSSVNWDLLGKDPFIILINHTSPLDSIFFAAMCPLKYAAKIRTLAKAELFQIPILGDLIKYCGHFPVHFLRSDIGNFSVDKEKQTKVIADIRQHLGNGGSLAFFPEGQLNRFDTSKLQPFRLGLFNILAEQGERSPASPLVNMYAFLHTGLEKTWHPTAKLGGSSAEIHCKILPLLFSRGSPVYEIQQAVQKGLDSMSRQSLPMVSSKL